jgi:hypothetical protein
MNGWWVLAALLALGPQPQASTPVGPRPGAPVVHGDLSVLADVFPERDDTRELRGRARVEVTSEPAAWLRLRFEGIAEGLVADRGGRVDAAHAEVREAWADVRTGRVELRAGYGRIVWGRLDEVMPSDVINPIDTAKFFLDGRAEARLPVAFVRNRVFLPAETTLEAVVALPGRRSRFDALDEETSPFNLLNDVVLPAGVPVRAGVRRETPRASWRHVQTGVRLSTTAGRVDMSVSAWRGFEGFGLVSFETQLEPGPAGVAPAVVGELVERYPKFTMIAGDMEMVRGDWAIRGEVAGFVDKRLSGPMGPIEGKAFDAGVGVDRSAGDYHLFGSVIWHREWSPASPSGTRSHVNVIASIDRRFSRERYLARVFGVVNPEDRSGFVRGLFSWSVSDNVLLEASAGLFPGEGTDTISRFNGRDFGFLRLRYHF